MAPSSSDLSPLVWLAATQFLLYGLGWGVSSLTLREQRAAVAHWALFMLLLGSGMVLTAMRGEPRTWWAYGGANFVLLSSVVVLRRGVEVFVGVACRDREHLILLGLAAAGFAVLGPDDVHASWRVVLAYGGPAWVVGRMVVTLRRAVVAEYGTTVALVLALPAVAVVAAFSARIAQQVSDMGRSLEMHLVNDANRGLLFGYVVAAAMYNFAFVAMLTLRFVKHLQVLTLRDPLTGLLNRRGLDADLQREWLRLQRGGPAFAVLALDLDHFKAVNDRWGHLAGDALLVQVARRLQQTARQIDTVARVGGEEFLVLVPQSTAEGAAAAAQRLIASFRAAPFDLAHGPVPITVSVGVAQADANDADLLQVLQRADAALYRAKAGGRDRACVDDQPEPRPDGVSAAA
jgi:diguanylate cyclase (GGDEF)-like protein